MDHCNWFITTSGITGGVTRCSLTTVLDYQWLHRGLMTLSETLVVVKLSNKIGYLCVRYMNPCLTLGIHLFRSGSLISGGLAMFFCWGIIPVHFLLNHFFQYCNLTENSMGDGSNVHILGS